MMEIFSHAGNSLGQRNNDHLYFKEKVEDSVVYCLRGYVIHKFAKHTACPLCINYTSSSVAVMSCDAYLTMYRNFKQGCLKHPTAKMLDVMKIVNNTVLLCLNEEGPF